MSSLSDPILRRLLDRFAPHRGPLLLALLLVALHSAVPGLLVLLVEVVLDDVLVAGDRDALAWIPLAVVALYAANGALGFARGMLTRTIAWNVISELRLDVFRALLQQEPAWHRAHASGTVTSWLVTDVEDIQYGVSAIVTAVQKPLTLLLLLLAAARMSVELTLVAVVAAPLVVWPVRRLGHRLREQARVGLDARARLAGFATETWSTIEGLQAASAEAPRTQHFDTHNRALRAAALRAFAARLLPSPLVELSAAVGVALVIEFGGREVLAGQLQPGELIAFLLAVGLLNDPLKGLAEVHTLAQRAAAGAARAFAVLDRAPALVDGPHAELSIDPTAPLLCFDGVTVDYGEGPVVRELHLSVACGEIVGLTGPSGAGKTSLLRLVPRLLDPAAGQVRIGGSLLDQHHLSSVRAAVAWVGQDPVLFDASVSENIALACPGASARDIEQAARDAGAHDFIMALPSGYDTGLQERGVRLSGGQRQRICIARAFLQNAPVLVLDEPTSALDAASEAVVQAALDRLCEGRAVLLVSHRPSTLSRAHRIVSLELPGPRSGESSPDEATP